MCVMSVHITIQGSGVGIKSDTLEHEFDRGYTSKGTEFRLALKAM